MRSRRLKKIVRKEIKRVIDLVGEKIDVEYNRCEIFMLYYDTNKQKIGFNLTSYLRNYYKEMKDEKISVKEYIITSTLHEIGHHKDEEIRKTIKRMKEIRMKENSLRRERKANKTIEIIRYQLERKKIDIEMEEKAWKIALELNEKHKLVEREVFNKVKEKSLQTYITTLKILESKLELREKVRAYLKNQN